MVLSQLRKTRIPTSDYSEDGDDDDDDRTSHLLIAQQAPGTVQALCTHACLNPVLLIPNCG